MKSADSPLMPLSSHESQGLVAARRLGAALSASRARSGGSLLAMSHRCDHWWRPDELAAYEQGARPLDDSVIVSLARLYELDGRPLPDSDAFGLLLDRSTARDVLTASELTDHTEDGAIFLRLAALLKLCGAWLTPMSAAVMADVAGITSGLVRQRMAELDGSTGVDEVARDLEAHIVVPVTGLLVAETPLGSLVAVRPAGNGRSPRGRVAAAASFRGLLGHANV